MLSVILLASSCCRNTTLSDNARRFGESGPLITCHSKSNQIIIFSIFEIDNYFIFQATKLEKITLFDFYQFPFSLKRISFISYDEHYLGVGNVDSVIVGNLEFYRR